MSIGEDVITVRIEQLLPEELQANGATAGRRVGCIYERAAGATAGRRGWREELHEVSGAAGSKRRPASLPHGLLACCWQQQAVLHIHPCCMCV